MTLAIATKTRFLLLVSSIFFFATSPLQAQEKIERFMSECESQITKQWQGKYLDEFQIPSHFRENAKGVVSFSIDDQGHPKRVKLQHGSAESLIIAAQVRYGQRAPGLLKAMDKAMIEAVKQCEFPPLPYQLSAHRHFAVVFDPQRFKPLRVLIDDQITIGQDLRVRTY